MVFKFDIALKEKVYHFETEAEALLGKKIGETVGGEELSKELQGYEFLITGASTKTGTPALARVEGANVKRILLEKGTGMPLLRKKKKRVKESTFELRKVRRVKGLRLRRRIKGNVITTDIVQINLKVTKEGAKPLNEVFAK